MTVSRSPAHALAAAAAPSTDAAAASPATTLLAGGVGSAVPLWLTAAPGARFPWPTTGVTDAHMAMAAAKALTAFPHPAAVLAVRSVVVSAPLAAERRPAPVSHNNASGFAGSAPMSASSPATARVGASSAEATPPTAPPKTRSHHRRDVLELLARFP
ncbi:hypothetical protein GGF31_008977 [Allomyces arbusculus]|nr:hypothetical protein GGF31_008977 [Allomyces arbusculus]